MVGGLEEGPTGPAQYVPPRGRRKLFVQETVDYSTLAFDRAEAAEKLAHRAVTWFEDQPMTVDWQTLEFRVIRTGMETDVDSEVWRWEIWTAADC